MMFDFLRLLQDVAHSQYIQRLKSYLTNSLAEEVALAEVLVLYPSRVVVSSSAYLLEVFLQVHSGGLFLLDPKMTLELIEEVQRSRREVQRLARLPKRNP
jgi:hypothetical protein